MTVEPASTRANRINPDCLDWLYIGTSVAVGNHGCGWPAPGRSGRHLRGSRQCLRVDVLPDARQPAITDSDGEDPVVRSEEHTSDLQSLMRISSAVFCWKKKT